MFTSHSLRRASKRALPLFLCLVLFLVSLPTLPASAQSNKASKAASELDADFAVDWMQVVYDNIKADTVSAPAASRIYAYAGVTLYEAVVPGMPGYVSLSKSAKGLTTLPALYGSDAKYDWPSVANGALSVVMSSLLPSDKSKANIAALKEQQIAARKSSVDPGMVDQSVTQGEALGKLLVDWISQDNYSTAHGKAYTMPTDKPYAYEITTPGTKPVEPYWGTLRPFGLENSDICEVKRNIDFSTDPNSTLYLQAMEVKTVNEKLTDEQKAIANFWVDTPGLTGAPAGHWVMIESQLVKRLNLKLDRAAEMYAMVGMALGDAFISCWELKYQDPFMRPETYIKKYIKRTWSPYIQTPPFPSYPSGHSVASGAAAQVLTGLFGTVAYTDATHVKENQPARSFTSFEAAAQEAALSRLYGGIHFRVDNENGLKQGKCVGQHILDNIKLHPAA